MPFQTGQSGSRFGRPAPTGDTIRTAVHSAHQEMTLTVKQIAVTAVVAVAAGLAQAYFLATVWAPALFGG